MDHFKQPKITGYRQLSDEEAALMNEIKQKGVELSELVSKLKGMAALISDGCQSALQTCRQG